MRNIKIASIVLLLFFIMLAVGYYLGGINWSVSKSIVKNPVEVERNTSSVSGTPKKAQNNALPKNAAERKLSGIPAGVNPVYIDKPETQVGWMSRAFEVIDKNLPDFAESAEVRNTFFHRGERAWAATCGEVQFYRGGKVAVDYQRFVYAGVQTVYYENDIPNFQIFWDKMCVQTMSDSGFERKE